MNPIVDYFFLPLSPVLAIAFAGLLLIVLECVSDEGLKPLKSFVAFSGPIFSIFFTWRVSQDWPSVFNQPLTTPVPAWLLEFTRVYRLDEMTLSFYWAVGIFLLITLLFFHSFYEEWDERNELLILTEFIAVGMMVLVSANDLLMLFLGLELMSLPTYVIVGFRKEDVKSCEAALKYFLFGSFGTVLLLLSIALLYGQFGTLKTPQLQFLLNQPTNLTSPLVLVALGLVIGAVGFKVGSAPFHLWLPDAYQGAPTSITGFMGSAVKLAGFALAIRVFGGVFLPLAEKWSVIVAWLAIISMFIGNFGALVQKNLKRVFAYSSIAHAGFLFLGVSSIAKEPESVQMVYYYLVTYGMMFLGLFAILSVMEQNGRSLDFDSLSGLGFKNPVLGFALALFAFSAAGIPPTAGFFAKYLILFETAKTQNMLFVVLAALSSAVGIYYYLKVIVHLYMKDSSGTVALQVQSPSTYLAILICAISLLFFTVFPSRLGIF